MPFTDVKSSSDQPLTGCRVVECSHSVAAAYAGRLLAAMGAQVVMLEPESGSALRQAPPWLEGSGESALFAYLSVGKSSRIAALDQSQGQQLLRDELAQAHIFIEDIPVAQRAACGLGSQAQTLSQDFPQLVHVSVLPFGATGPKAHWSAEEVNLLHAGGEGYLLPNGLSYEIFPERAPLKIYGHFASYQAGASAAMCALAAWWAAPTHGGQYVDVSAQDANLTVGAFALQRLGDGSLEHRATRKFRYGGVFQTQDGYLELLTLEDRQWQGLTELLGTPAWAQDAALQDPLERSRRGDEINQHIRTWMAQHPTQEIVRRAQELGVPAAKYRTPTEVIEGEHERARGLFGKVALPSGREVEVLAAPFQFHCTPLRRAGRVAGLGEMQAKDQA